jgi:hypothetical protein
LTELWQFSGISMGQSTWHPRRLAVLLATCRHLSDGTLATLAKQAEPPAGLGESEAMCCLRPILFGGIRRKARGRSATVPSCSLSSDGCR